MHSMTYKKVKNPLALSVATFKGIYDSSFIVNEARETYDVCGETGKYRYSYPQARKKKQNMKFAAHNRNKLFLRIYLCPHCHDWHLTSTKKDDERKSGKNLCKKSAKYQNSAIIKALNCKEHMYCKTKVQAGECNLGFLRKK